MNQNESAGRLLLVKSIGKLAGVGIYLADYIEREMSTWEVLKWYRDMYISHPNTYHSTPV